jgi:hypothetical protein
MPLHCGRIPFLSEEGITPKDEITLVKAQAPTPRSWFSGAGPAVHLPQQRCRWPRIHCNYLVGGMVRTSLTEEAVEHRRNVPECRSCRFQPQQG